MVSPTTSSELERTFAWKLALHHHAGVFRIGDVDRGEVLRCGLVREPQDPAPVARELHAHPLADAAKALQLVVREELHVESERLIGAVCDPGKRLSHLR